MAMYQIERKDGRVIIRLRPSDDLSVSQIKDLKDFQLIAALATAVKLPL